MSCTVSGAFILFTVAKDTDVKGSHVHVIFLLYCCQKSTKKDKIYTFFGVKMVDIIM